MVKTCHQSERCIRFHSSYHELTPSSITACVLTDVSNKDSALGCIVLRQDELPIVKCLVDGVRTNVRGA